MKTLTDRKIAEQERVTYEIQKSAQIERKEFESAKAGADMQPEVVKSTRQVEINTQLAASKFAAAKGDAESRIINAKADAKNKTINAKADAAATEINGNADAGKIKAIGLAEAEVTKQKTEAMGTEQYEIVRVAEALASNGIKLVPEILVSGKDGGNSGMIDALIGNEMLKKLQRERKSKSDAS